MGSLEDRSMQDLHDEYLHSPEMDARRNQTAYSNEPLPFSDGHLPVGRRNNMIGHGVYRSIKTVVLSNKLNLLMPFGPLAILVHKLTAHNVSFWF